MNHMQQQLKKAFDAQQNEVKKLSAAYNTMRMLLTTLILQLEPETRKVVISAKSANEVGEELANWNLNVDNQALSDAVTLSVSRMDEPVVASVSPESGEIEKANEQPKEELVEVELPTMCICGDMSTDHVGRAGRCKKPNCSCAEFKEKKYNN